jgi:hypothetical protein
MFDVVQHGGAFNFLSKTQLVRLKLKAVRSGAWFKALLRIDRALIDLTLKVTRCNVRSVALARNILAIIEKLGGILESSYSRVTREVGFPLARKISALAKKWGNVSADHWSSDRSFATFLGVLSINEPKAFKASLA